MPNLFACAKSDEFALVGVIAYTFIMLYFFAYADLHFYLEESREKLIYMRYLH